MLNQIAVGVIVHAGGVTVYEVENVGDVKVSRSGTIVTLDEIDIMIGSYLVFSIPEDHEGEAKDYWEVEGKPEGMVVNKKVLAHEGYSSYIPTRGGKTYVEFRGTLPRRATR